MNKRSIENTNILAFPTPELREFRIIRAKFINGDFTTRGGAAKVYEFDIDGKKREVSIVTLTEIFEALNRGTCGGWAGI